MDRQELLGELQVWLAHSRQFKCEHVSIPCTVMEEIILIVRTTNADAKTVAANESKAEESR